MQDNRDLEAICKDIISSPQNPLAWLELAEFVPNEVESIHGLPAACQELIVIPGHYPDHMDEDLSLAFLCYLQATNLCSEGPAEVWRSFAKFVSFYEGSLFLEEDEFKRCFPRLHCGNALFPLYCMLQVLVAAPENEEDWANLLDYMPSDGDDHAVNVLRVMQLCQRVLGQLLPWHEIEDGHDLHDYLKIRAFLSTNNDSSYALQEIKPANLSRWLPDKLRQHYSHTVCINQTAVLCTTIFQQITQARALETIADKWEHLLGVLANNPELTLQQGSIPTQYRAVLGVTPEQHIQGVCVELLRLRPESIKGWTQFTAIAKRERFTTPFESFLRERDLDLEPASVELHGLLQQLLHCEPSLRYFRWEALAEFLWYHWEVELKPEQLASIPMVGALPEDKTQQIYFCLCQSLNFAAEAQRHSAVFTRLFQFMQAVEASEDHEAQPLEMSLFQGKLQDRWQLMIRDISSDALSDLRCLTYLQQVYCLLQAIELDPANHDAYAYLAQRMHNIDRDWMDFGLVQIRFGRILRDEYELVVPSVFGPEYDFELPAGSMPSHFPALFASGATSSSEQVIYLRLAALTPQTTLEQFEQTGRALNEAPLAESRELLAPHALANLELRSPGVQAMLMQISSLEKQRTLVRLCASSAGMDLNQIRAVQRISQLYHLETRLAWVWHDNPALRHWILQGPSVLRSFRFPKDSAKLCMNLVASYLVSMPPAELNVAVIMRQVLYYRLALQPLLNKLQQEIKSNEIGSGFRYKAQEQNSLGKLRSCLQQEISFWQPRQEKPTEPESEESSFELDQECLDALAVFDVGGASAPKKVEPRDPAERARYLSILEQEQSRLCRY